MAKAATHSILQRSDAAEGAAPARVLVAGAGGGIGAALCAGIARRFPGVVLVRLAREPRALPALDADTCDITCDITDEASIARAVQAMPDRPALDWVLGATGWLHGDGRMPEKYYRQLDPDHLLYAYRTNAIGPMLLLKHLIPDLDRRHRCRIGLLSARVGSISDNRLGGWHAYRASKAALNMLIKNLAIELARTHRDLAVVGLQPGTTDTRLSAPFQRGVAEGQLQSPEYTADCLLRVMQALRSEDSGGLFDFAGLPFEP